MERYACRIEVRYFSSEAMWEFCNCSQYVVSWKLDGLEEGGGDGRCDALL